MKQQWNGVDVNLGVNPDVRLDNGVFLQGGLSTGQTICGAADQGLRSAL